MRSRRTWLWCFAAVAPLVLGGCLLPQPDTPPIPPGSPMGKSVPNRSPVAPALPQPDTPPIAPLKPGAGVVSENGGALIPQPDTPPISPMLPQPDTPPIAANAGGAEVYGGRNGGDLVTGNAAMPAPAMGVAMPSAAASAQPAAAGKLGGTVKGLPVVTVEVEDESGETTYQRTAVGSDGSFAFKLSPGRYRLVVTLENGRQFRLGQAFVVASDESRSYAITLRESPPGATVAEDAPLADESASSTPSPKP